MSGATVADVKWRLRQVALVAEQLAPVDQALRDALGVEVAYRDPGVGEFGLENVLFTLGDTFLEVVSPIREGTTAGRYLGRRAGDGGYMVILQGDDLDAARRRVADLGVRVVWKTDLPTMRGTHLHPADVGGAILSLDWADPPESWLWAGPSWQPNRAGEITAVDVQADDPAKMAARWAEVLECPVGADNVMRLDRGAIRFVPAEDGRGDGVAGIDVTGGPQPPGTSVVCGVRITFAVA
jgi:hypothetical protein